MEPDRKLQLSALRILDVILDVCAARTTSWKETILDAVARCWIGIFDEETTTNEQRKGIVFTNSVQAWVLNKFEIADESETINERELVKIELQNLCAKLAQVCPTIIKVHIDEYSIVIVLIDTSI